MITPASRALPALWFVILALRVSAAAASPDAAPSDAAPIETPRVRPAPPGEPVASVFDRYQIKVGWQSGWSDVDGFEVQQECAGGRFARVGLLAGDDPSFLHHARLPGHAYAYRVRAFNAAGFSAPSALVRVQMPSTAVMAQPTAGDEPPATTTPDCTSFDAVSADSRTIRVVVAGQVLDFKQEDPSQIWTSGSTQFWLVYAQEVDCYRRIGRLEIGSPQGDLIGAIPIPPERWPLLVTRFGSRRSHPVISVWQSQNGPSEVVDRYAICGEQPTDPDALPQNWERLTDCQFPDPCPSFRRF